MMNTVQCVNDSRPHSALPSTSSTDYIYAIASVTLLLRQACFSHVALSALTSCLMIKPQRLCKLNKTAENSLFMFTIFVLFPIFLLTYEMHIGCTLHLIFCGNVDEQR